VQPTQAKQSNIIIHLLKIKNMAKAKKTNTGQQKGYQYCSMIKIPPRQLPPGISAGRVRAIITIDRKWMNGTVLKYYFFNGGTDGSPASWKGAPAQMNAVRQAFQTWKGLGIGLSFEEVNDKNEAQVRIGFLRGDGSWSYVGRDVIDISSSPDERSMNFGWDISNDIDTAVHEIGHTLGMPHEHQNPFAGIVWNEEAVYAALAAPPNSWDRDTTFHNIIRKLDPNEVEGSTHDSDSVMHYPFEAGLILEPAAFRNGINPAGGLSAKDREYMKKFYPALAASDYTELKLSQSQPMQIQAGGQKNFTFTPARSKKYTIETFGQADTLMVLYEKSGNEEIYLSGDDDSGLDTNSKIQLRLIKGRKYIIRVRLFYADAEGSVSVMIY
jgi:hypothetical protein